MSMRVVVVGGGITGLAAAWSMLRAGDRTPEVVLLEASPRLGGKILTERVGEFLIEGGPDSFLTLRPEAVEFVHEVGLGDDLVGTLEPGGAYILHHGRLHPLPDGLSSLIPQRLGPFLRSSLFSPWEKARFAWDLFVPPAEDGAEESVGTFVRRRLGEAAVERLAAPLFAGIHAGDVDRLSLPATFPQFIEAERRYGSLTRAVLARRRASRGARALPIFMTLRGGLRDLVDGAAAELPAGTIRTTAAVDHIGRQGSRYAVILETREIITADVVVLATPAPAAGKILGPLNPAAADLLPSISYASTAAVALAFPREGVAHPLRGHGYVTSRSERTLHTACTWVHAKWPGRAPPGHVLLRAYAGRAGDQRALDMDDAALAQALVRELTPLLGLSAPPVLTRVYRWADAMPQYEIGHSARLAALRRTLRTSPGILLAGAAYEGVGIPDCIRQGKEAAGAAIEFLYSGAR